jgi:hypothetical protein
MTTDHPDIPRDVYRNTYLDIYLDDHRAGAAAGLALARRMSDRYGGEPGFEALVGLANDIDDDVRSLDELRERIGSTGGAAKRAVALVGERLGRLKPNGHLLRESPLSKLLELELLSAGVAAKRRLWDALTAACGNERLAGLDLQRLSGRADEQLAIIHDLHRLAASALPCPAPEAPTARP